MEVWLEGVLQYAEEFGINESDPERAGNSVSFNVEIVTHAFRRALAVKAGTSDREAESQLDQQTYPGIYRWF